MNYQFPKDFMWGVGGSAFQMEGAMLEDGKTLNTREASFFATEGPREAFIDPIPRQFALTFITSTPRI